MLKTRFFIKNQKWQAFQVAPWKAKPGLWSVQTGFENAKNCMHSLILSENFERN